MKRKNPQTLQEAGQQATEAFNEFGRLLKLEVERTAKQIEDSWRRYRESVRR